MRQVQIANEVYEQAKLRAIVEGFESVDDYVGSVLAEIEAANLETPNLDHLFTPLRIAELDLISAEIKSGGKTFTVEESREVIARHRAEWLRLNHK